MLSEWVDFHWEVNGQKYVISMPGGGFVSFQKLLEVLGRRAGRNRCQFREPGSRAGNRNGWVPHPGRGAAEH